MKRKGLWEIAEEINKNLPGDKDSRFILYGSDHHSADEAAYIFEKKIDYEKMTLLNKVHKFFFEKDFHETKNKPLIKLDNFMNIDYMTVNYIQPMQKELEDIAKDFSEKYNLQYENIPKSL